MQAPAYRAKRVRGAQRFSVMIQRAAIPATIGTLLRRETRGFLSLFFVPSMAQATLLTVVPLEALHLLDSARAVTLLYVGTGLVAVAGLAAHERATIRDSHRERERRRAEFQTKIRSLIRGVVEDANRHLATRPEGCRFCEMSAHFAGPWYPGHTICNPIAYELRVDGEKVGETLIIDLTQAGMIEASLRPPDLSGRIPAGSNLGSLQFLCSLSTPRTPRNCWFNLRAIITWWPSCQEGADPA